MGYALLTEMILFSFSMTIRVPQLLAQGTLGVSTVTESSAESLNTLKWRGGS